MIKNFTENDIIQYLYNELNEDYIIVVKNKMEKSEKLRSEFFAFDEIKNLIDGFVLEVPPKITNRLIELSRNGAIKGRSH